MEYMLIAMKKERILLLEKISGVFTLSIAHNIKIVEGLASAEVLRTIGCYPKLSLSLNFGYGGRKIN